MELNIDAIRAVLQYIKDNTHYENNIRINKGYFTQIDIIHGVPDSDKYTSNDVAYSLELLFDTNLLQFLESPKYLPSGRLNFVKIRGLTIEGHSFLEKTKNPTIWEAIKTKAKKTGEFSLKAICDAATLLGAAMMADPNAANNFIEGTKNLGHIISGM